MKFTPINLRVYCATSAGPGLSEPIPGFAIGLVAYHRPFEPDQPGKQSDHCWTVTHIPTGLAFSLRVWKEKTVRAIVQMLNKDFAKVLPKLKVGAGGGVSKAMGDRIRLAIRKLERELN